MVRMQQDLGMIPETQIAQEEQFQEEDF